MIKKSLDFRNSKNETEHSSQFKIITTDIHQPARTSPSIYQQQQYIVIVTNGCILQLYETLMWKGDEGENYLPVKKKIHVHIIYQ